jgi:hypothetical protein
MNRRHGNWCESNGVCSSRRCAQNDSAKNGARNDLVIGHDADNRTDDEPVISEAIDESAFCDLAECGLVHLANRNFIAGTLFAASFHSVDYTLEVATRSG